MLDRLGGVHKADCRWKRGDWKRSPPNFHASLPPAVHLSPVLWHLKGCRTCRLDSGISVSASSIWKGSKSACWDPRHDLFLPWIPPNRANENGHSLTRWIWLKVWRARSSVCPRRLCLLCQRAQQWKLQNFEVHSALIVWTDQAKVPSQPLVHFHSGLVLRVQNGE